MQYAMLALGAVLVPMSAWLFWRGRQRADDARTALMVPSIGAVSTTTCLVVGAAGFATAYHLVVHALGYTQFRAPLPVALGVAAVAVLASFGADAMENRAGRGPE